jgi:hypothetical protein
MHNVRLQVKTRRNIMKMRLWIAVALLVLPLVACNGTSATIDLRADESFYYLTVNMTEEEVQALFEGIFAENNELNVSNPVVDLRPGEIALTGEVASGTGETVPANLTLLVGAVDGQLNASVTDANFAGWEGTQAWLDQINSNIAAGIADAVQNRTDNAELSDVTITDTGLSFTIRAPRDE